MSDTVMQSFEQEFEPVITRVMAERGQGHSTRKNIFPNLENYLGRPIVTYFTSNIYPVGVTDADVDMIEGFLQAMDLSKGLALMISSLGGDGIAAERLIKVCRSYSKTGEFWAIVPGKAKSAATMVCLGASKIFMGPASELGPIDPQVLIYDNREHPNYISAFHVVRSYYELFEKARKEIKGRLEPYLQQLSNYNASVVSHYQSLIDLSEDISVKALSSGMMNKLSKENIRKKIKIFLIPEKTKTHGRPIFQDDARMAGLNIEKIDTSNELGQSIYELYIRSRSCADRQVSKLIETIKESIYFPPVIPSKEE